MVYGTGIGAVSSFPNWITEDRMKRLFASPREEVNEVSRKFRDKQDYRTLYVFSNLLWTEEEKIEMDLAYSAYSYLHTAV